jgi:hypothetical protein
MSSDLVLELSRTSSALLSLPDDYFFAHSTTLEIRLPNHELSALPPSISQCALVVRINLSGNLFSKPPAILFTCPFLRANPLNVIFGDDQRCTPGLMYEILNGCRHCGQSILTFRKYSRRTRCEKMFRVSISAHLTSLDFFCLVQPKVAMYPGHFFIVRTIKIGRPYTLLITPDFVPMFLYNYPGATFSIELKSFSSALLPLDCFESLFPRFLGRQISYHWSQQLASLAHRWPLSPVTVADELGKISALFDLAFTVYLVNQKVEYIVVVVSEDSVRVIFGSQLYYVFKRSTVRVQLCQKGNELCAALCFGARALALDPARLETIVPLLALLGVQAPPRQPALELPRWEFIDLAERAIVLGTSAEPRWPAGDS